MGARTLAGSPGKGDGGLVSETEADTEPSVPLLLSLLQRLRAVRSSTWLVVAASIAATVPAWIVRHPPITDWPFHEATIRVLRSFHDPAFGFDAHYELKLGNTQYVAYYLLGALLAFPFGVKAAQVLLVSSYLAGTVLGMRALVLALGKDERLALFVVPLLYNVLFMFGLLPFLLGIPAMLFALALTLEQRREPSVGRGVVLALLVVLLFHLHFFPFGVFALGAMLLAPWNRPRAFVVYSAPFAPAVLLALRWMFFTEAGKLSSGALFDRHAIRPPLQSLNELWRWLLDVGPDDRDELVFVGFVLALLLAGALAQGDRDHDEDRASAGRALGLLPMVCLALYFLLEEGHGYIWIIAQRFPFLFLLLLVPLVRMPRGNRGEIVTGAALALAAASITVAAQRFVRFELDEVGDIDEAIEQIPPRSKVAALIFDKGSHVVHHTPFLHFGSYAQTAHGGVVQFSYAGYAHWPFDYLPGAAPPPGGPARLRWEWTPEETNASGELRGYYDVVLTRGAGFDGDRNGFRVRYQGNRWAVWERKEPAGAQER
jgi:hypothetical protein